MGRLRYSPNSPLRVILPGSAPWLIEQGLTESLAGRFEIVHLGYWSFGEMRDAFGIPETWGRVAAFHRHGTFPSLSDGNVWSHWSGGSCAGTLPALSDGNVGPCRNGIAQWHVPVGGAPLALDPSIYFGGCPGAAPLMSRRDAARSKSSMRSASSSR